MAPTTDTFTDPFGVPITYYVWEAARERAVVQICHGYGEHAARYDELAQHLNAAGYTVYANDHRGHGQTGLQQWQGRTDRLGYLGDGGIRATIGDITQLSDLMREQRPGLPVVLVAHSWGSVLAQIILNKQSVAYDAVVLSGTVYRMPGSMHGGDLNKRFTTPGGTGFEWLSRDSATVAAAAADPLMTKVSSVKALNLTDTLRQFGRPARRLPPDLPLLIMVGSEDAFGGAESARRLAEAYRRRSAMRDVELIAYDGARHEIFNETNQADVFADLIGWLDQRTITVGQS